MTQLLLAIDVGGTKIEAVAVDLRGQTVARMFGGTDNSGPEGLLESIDETVHRVLAKARATAADLLGVGMGVPGQVNTESGVVRLAVNLKLSSFPLAMALAGRLLRSARCARLYLWAPPWPCSAFTWSTPPSIPSTPASAKTFWIFPKWCPSSIGLPTAS